MKRKALEKTAIVPCPKLSKRERGEYEYFATSQLHEFKDETVLEITLYRLRENAKKGELPVLELRYFASINKMQYEVLVGTKWKQRKLDGSEWCGYGGIDIKFFYEDMIKEYLKEHRDYSWEPRIGSWISRFEMECNSIRREKALLRKQERINSVMERVDGLGFPKDFEQWLLSKQKGDYIFKSKGIGKCSCCGKEIELGKRGKDGEQITCPSCKKTVTVLTRKKDIVEKTQAVLVQELDEQTIVIRHFGVELSKKNQEIYGDEKVRFVIERETNNMKIYYLHEMYFSDEWKESRNGFQMRTGYCYPNTIELLKGTAYEESMAICLAKIGVKANYNGLMRYSHKEHRGHLEYFAKMGLYRLTEQLSDGDWLDKKYLKKGKTATEILGLDKQRINRLKQENGNTNMLLWLRYEMGHNEKIPKEVMDWLIKNRITVYDLARFLEYLTVVKTVNYIKKQQNTPKQTIQFWKDYLDMAEQFDMDITDSIVLLPKDLMTRHNQYVERLNATKNEKRDAEVNEKYAKIAERHKELSQKYQYQNQKYIIVVPRCASDITREGRILHHCVGGERYLSNMAEGVSDIIFVRNREEQDKPYYTVEIKRNKVVQYYSEFDRKPNKEEIRRFLNGLENKLVMQERKAI